MRSNSWRSINSGSGDDNGKSGSASSTGGSNSPVNPDARNVFRDQELERLLSTKRANGVPRAKEPSSDIPRQSSFKGDIFHQASAFSNRYFSF